MVYIKKVEIRGFKSFPNRTVSIAFSPKLNVITGLNGSGKSNIVDAMRFALGENSPKALRQPKLVKLLFDKEKINSTRVTLILDNSDRAIPLEEDTVYISRELKASGESTYYINHRRASRGSVVELLNSARISYDGLNIVPQGTITRVAEFNPNERRQVLESLVGLKVFDERKAEAMEKLRDADTKLAIAFAKLDEKRAQIERLEEERNELKRFEQLEKRIREYRASILRYEIAQLEAKRGVLMDRLRHISVNISDRKERLERIQEEVKGLEKVRSDFYGANVDGIMEKLTSINKELQRVRMEMAEKEDRMRSLTEEKERIESSRPQLAQMLEERSKELEGLKGRLDELKSELKDMEERRNILLEELDKKRTEVRKRERALSKWKESFQKIQSKLKKVKDRRLEVEKLLSDERERYEETKLALEDVRKRYEEASSIIRSLKERIEQLNEFYKIDESDFKQVKNRLTELEKVRNSLIKEMTRANGVVLKSLKELTLAEAKQEAYERLFKDIAAAERVEEFLSTGALEGYLGKLVDLMEIDDRYEKAVKAVVMPWFGTLIVEDEEVKKRIIELVKKIEGGRVRVLSLALKGKRVEVKGPGVIGPVSNFIICDRRVKPLIESLFGSAFIVSDESVAKTLANKGYTAVTLDGTVFRVRGLVEVGLVPEAEAKEIAVDKKRLRMLKKALSSLDRVLSRKRDSLEKLRNEIRKLVDLSLEKKLEVERKVTQLEVLKNMASRYIKLERRMRERVTKLEKKVRAAELRVKKLETYKKRLEEKERGFEERKGRVIEKLSEIRLEEMEKELKRLEEEETALVEKVMGLNLRISEVSKEMTGELEPRVKRLEESIKTGEERLEEIGLELDKMNRDLAVLKLREEELEEKREKEEEKVTKFTPTLNKLELDLREIRERERKLEESIWRMEKEKVRVQADIDRVMDEIELKSKELKELNVQEIPEYHTGLSSLLSELEGELSLLYGAVNQLAKQAYKEAYTSYKLASVRRRELEKDRNAIVRFIEEVESEKKRTFMAAFEKIDREVRKIFNKLTDGEGWLELENEEDPFSGGVFLMVKFPEKTAKEASSVSGGEKTVSAVSFLLALQAAYPSPFYLLDEVDMNLDPMYTEKLSQLLREWAKDTQLIVITLKDLMTAKAHNIIGVYATGGISNVVRYKLEKEGLIK